MTTSAEATRERRMVTVSTTDTTGAQRTGDWIQLVSGSPFWPLDPRPGEIEIHDIAWALSMQCRYGGHSQEFYSVAEHSVLVSQLVPPEHALWGLLHDATEAYLVDVPRPVKRSLPEYTAIEDRLAECIAERFGLCWPMPAEVKAADTAILHLERAAVMAPSMLPWEIGHHPMVVPGDVAVRALPPGRARWAFLDRFFTLTQVDADG